MVFCCTGKLFLLPERYVVSHFLYLVENINVIADSYSKIYNRIIRKQLVLLDWYLWNYKHYRFVGIVVDTIHSSGHELYRPKHSHTLFYLIFHAQRTTVSELSIFGY